MSSIFITGSSGFVGLNLIEYLRSFFICIKYQREVPIEINQDIVIHLAGKAHDIKKTSNSKLPNKIVALTAHVVLKPAF